MGPGGTCGGAIFEDPVRIRLSMASTVGHRSSIAGSALVEIMNIKKSSIWRVLHVAKVEAL
jgi:hypothetical protein